ncbi:MAG: LysR family transcriptional regulator [Rhodospirillaceae bacterium]|nr:LysR family transcriptional regulator [Rhodospirillaceae bacterium]MBT5566761.1 LysR family transcriptional regulator [Rhodospirillaceae bacterium]MBT6090823.1 LysR family transcriptional regulator [Rhodospirillaceae bacterium]MBT7451841.1 LysR family transcriptional regulator [Rhodospirillaceae bacterium]
MDWSVVRDFLAVVETGSLSAAARKLKVSQPTLSRRIADLEEKLGATLFLRTPKGLLMTETGEGILADAREMETSALAIERRADAGRDALEGLVRVSCTEGLGTKWLPQHLRSFHETYPRLQVEILVDNRALNLVRREADIALRLFRPEQPDLIARKLGGLAMGMYGSKDYLAEYGVPDKVSDLKPHFHVGFDESLQGRSEIQVLETMFEAERIIHRSNSFVGQYEAARAGIGLAMIDCFLGDADPNLERILPDKLFHTVEVWLVTHAEVSRSARIRVLFDHIAACFEADKSRVEGFDGPPVAS